MHVHIKGDARRHKFKVLRSMTSDAAHSFVSLTVLHTDTLNLFLVCSTCSKLDFQQSQE